MMVESSFVLLFKPLDFARHDIHLQVIQKYEDEEIQNYNFVCFLCECETWSLAPKKEGKLRVFENRALKRILGPKRDEVAAVWRKLHNYLGDQIEKNEMGGTCSTYGKEEMCTQGFNWESRGKEINWKTQA
jgi:hypothetical protein